MIPRRLVTTWICSPEQDRYTSAHRRLFERCLRSWLRLMPDYALDVVTLGNLYDLGRDPWVEARVAEGNFIGASQWARLRWLQEKGGIYVDMDVEAVQRFDALLGHPLGDVSLFLGHMGAAPFANNAVMGSVPGHAFLEMQMRHLLHQCDPADPEFGNASGPFMVTHLLQLLGWQERDANAVVAGTIAVHDSKTFHPYGWREAYTPACHAPHTVAVHHWGESWKPKAGLAVREMTEAQWQD